MNKRKVYFKADASSEIGYGHFIRTLALADMLKDDFECTFFTSEPNDYQKGEVAKVCPLHPLSFDTAEETFLQLLTGDEIVVLDNYYYTAEYQKQIKDKGCKLVCIDDIADRYFYADVVINHAPGILPESYKCEPYTQLLLGVNYLLLRKEFFQATKATRSSKDNTTFICFGGSDEYNFTLKTCKIIRQIDKRPIIAVIGGGYLHASELREFAKDNAIEVHHSVSAQGMVDLMMRSSIAIVPSSSILLEACCTRIPIITGYEVNNQEKIASCCDKLGLVYCCGDLNDSFETKIREALLLMNPTFKSYYVQNQVHLINDSSERLIAEFKKLEFS